MSKNNDAVDVLNDMVWGAIKGGVWLTWTGGEALYNWMKTPLAVKLQRLAPKKDGGTRSREWLVPVVMQSIRAAECNVLPVDRC